MRIQQRPDRWRCIAVATLLVGLSTTATLAASIRLPPPLRRAPAAIAQQCPECTTTGFVACGTADVAYGKRFARAALQGRPARGYLVTFVMSGEEFRAVARRSSYETLTATLRDRFSQARLVVLEAPAARVLPPPQSVTVTFPPALHACVHDSNKPWGCCVASACRDECCEKGLGSPSVTLAWNDAKTHESVQFTFHHMVGFSRIDRRGAREHEVYYCLIEEAARLAE